MKVVRLVCAFVPLVVTLIAIIVRGGWPGLVSALTMGAWETGKKWRAIFIVILYSMFLLFNIMVISLSMIGADKYYKNIRRWVRSRKLPVLDRYILPLLYILMAVPGLLLTAQPETYPNALSLELTVPVIFTFLYFIIVGEAFQYTGLTKKLSRDKTFLSITEAFYNLRIAVAALGFLFIAAASWIAIAHPQWL